MKVITRAASNEPGHSLSDLIRLQKDDLLRFNEEYQRAPAWKMHQKQLFIDSIFRGYSIPAFYLHKVQKRVVTLDGEIVSEHYDVIDGQQRIRAICEFVQDHFALLKPEDFKLPNFLGDKMADWAGKKFSELSPELRGQFEDQPVVIYEMQTDDDNEIRDLFIRLQGGTPLSAQDKRDTYPGQLPEFVKKMAGKPPLNKDDLVRYQGEPFFNELVWGKEKTSQKRQLAAQLLLLLNENAPNGKLSFRTINSSSIDGFYWRKSSGDFDKNSELATRFKQIISGLGDAFGMEYSPPLQGHEVIHLCLLYNSLQADSVVHGWQRKLKDAFTLFRQQCAIAKREKEGAYFMQYVRWISQSAANADTIERRHEFFVKKMLEVLVPKTKDPKRAFSLTERQIIYYRDHGYCQWCRMAGEQAPVKWRDAECHHIVPHAAGGSTEVDNGALMHKDCHPKSAEKTQKFQQWWEEAGKKREEISRGRQKQRRVADLPSGTGCRFEHGETDYEGKIANGKLMIPDIGEFSSFKNASETIIGGKPATNKNWWSEWEILLPNSEHWMAADDWRE